MLTKKTTKCRDGLEVNFKAKCGSLLKILGLILGAGLLLHTTARGEGLSLADCLQEALQNNSEIRTAQQEVAKASGAIISARASLLPTIGSSANVNMEDSDAFNEQPAPHLGFRDDWSVGLALSQNIYSGGINQNKLTASKLESQASRDQLKEVTNQIVFLTRKAYYDVLRGRFDIEVKKQNIELLRKEVDRQKSLFEAGRATKFNILRTEVRLANALPAYERVTTDYEASMFSLLNVMGRKYKVGETEALQLSGQLEMIPFAADANQLVVTALSRSPELSRQQKQIEINRLNAKNARASIIPKVDFFAATRIRQDESQGTGFFENKNQSSFGLVGSWNIFDGFAGKGNAMQAEATMRQNTILREGSARRIEYDVRKAVLALKQAEGSLRTQEGNVQKAKQSIELARSSVEAGLSTQFDILQATVDLSEAQNIELQARYDYNVALAQLEKVAYLRMESTDNLVPPVTSTLLPQTTPESPIKN